MIKIYVYIIRSKIKNYNYVGMTDNLDRRLNEHNSGYNKTTKPYAPFDIIHSEYFDSRKDARTKEKFFKSGAGREWVKKILLS